MALVKRRIGSRRVSQKGGGIRSGSIVRQPLPTNLVTDIHVFVYCMRSCGFRMRSHRFDVHLYVSSLLPHFGTTIALPRDGQKLSWGTANCLLVQGNKWYSCSKKYTFNFLGVRVQPFQFFQLFHKANRQGCITFTPIK